MPHYHTISISQEQNRMDILSMFHQATVGSLEIAFRSGVHLLSIMIYTLPLQPTKCSIDARGPKFQMHVIRQQRANTYMSFFFCYFRTDLPHSSVNYPLRRGLPLLG